MEEKLKQLEKEIQLLKERNSRVEADKSWETSKFRIFTITIVTYLVALVVLRTMNSKNILVSALIPAVGYLLSTQSLPFIKKWWIAKNKAK